MPARRTPSRSRTIRSYLMFWPVLQDLRVLEDGAEDLQGARPWGSGPGRPGSRGRRGRRTPRPGGGRRTARRAGPGSGTGLSVSVSRATSPAAAIRAARARSSCSSRIGPEVSSAGRPGGLQEIRRGARRTRAPRRDGRSPSRRAPGRRKRSRSSSSVEVAAHRDQPPAELEQVPVLDDLLPDAGVLDPSSRPSRLSREPNSWMSDLAVFSPMPGTPGTLSVGSPQRARTSTTSAGLDPEDAP